MHIRTATLSNNIHIYRCTTDFYEKKHYKNIHLELSSLDEGILVVSLKKTLLEED